MSKPTDPTNHKSESDMCILQEYDPKASIKEQIPVTIDDESDSEIIVVKENIRRKRLNPRHRNAGACNKGKRVKCSECNFQTISLNNLQLHEKTHSRSRIIKCSRCPFETRMKSCMIYHMAMHSGKKYRCYKCKFKTNFLDEFILHENAVYKCKTCQLQFHLQKERNLHIIKTHKVDDEMKRNEFFCCPVCTFKTEHKEYFKVHLCTSHPFKICQNNRESIGLENRSRNNFYCFKCAYKTNSKFKLDKHLRMSHLSYEENPLTGELQCNNCSFVTDDFGCMNIHIKYHFKGKFSVDSNLQNKLIKCSFCDFETEFESMMQSHLGTHENVDSDFDFEEYNDDDGLFNNEEFLEVNNKASYIERKPFPKLKCKLCNFTSEIEKEFNNHLSIHLRVDVFQCIFS